MTVAELIAHLQALDPTMRVMTEAGCDGELLGDMAPPHVVNAHGWPGDSVWAGRFRDDTYLAPGVARPTDFKVVLL